VAAALLAVYLLWGSTYLGIRYAIDSLPPFTMAAARFVLAGGLLFLIVRLRSKSATNWRHWVSALVVGTLLLGVGNGAVVWAEQSVPSGVVAVVVSTSAIWMVVADRALFGVRLHWPQVAGIAVGLVGIVILANPQASVVPVIPALVLVVSAVSWGFGSVLSRRVPMPASVAMGNGMQMLMGGLVFVLIALVSTAIPLAVVAATGTVKRELHGAALEAVGERGERDRGRRSRGLTVVLAL
jgi:drug/metabolite transporter (DMT)-like permease